MAGRIHPAPRRAQCGAAEPLYSITKPFTLTVTTSLSVVHEHLAPAGSSWSHAQYGMLSVWGTELMLSPHNNKPRESDA